MVCELKTDLIMDFNYEFKNIIILIKRKFVNELYHLSLKLFCAELFLKITLFKDSTLKNIRFVRWKLIFLKNLIFINKNSFFLRLNFVNEFPIPNLFLFIIPINGLLIMLIKGLHRFSYGK